MVSWKLQRRYKPAFLISNEINFVNLLKLQILSLSADICWQAYEQFSNILSLIHKYFVGWLLCVRPNASDVRRYDEVNYALAHNSTSQDRFFAIFGESQVWKSACIIRTIFCNHIHERQF